MARVRSDRDEASFDGYLREMPWKALRFADRKTKAALSSVRGCRPCRPALSVRRPAARAVQPSALACLSSQLFEVQGIPTLVFIDKDGAVFCKDGRSKVMGEPDSFPWPPKARDVLSEAMDYINEKACLLYTSPSPRD